MAEDIKKRIEGRIGAAFSGNDAGDSINVWQTVYGDLMTNLLLFFLTMFSLSMTGQKEYDAAAKAFKDTIEGREVQGSNEPELGGKPQDTETLNEFFTKFAEDQKDVEIVVHGEGIRLRMPEPVLFDI